MALIGRIDEFNPDNDDWIIYQERLEQFFLVNKIKEDMQGATLLSLVGSSVYQTLRDLTSPKLPKDEEYKNLVTMLRNQYSPHVSTLRERIKFYSVMQEENECINDWNVRIRRLATNCKFGNILNEVLKDKFLSGMRKSRTQDRLCEDETKSYAELLTLAQKTENIGNQRTAELNWI